MLVRIGGAALEIRINGKVYRPKGDFTVIYGYPEREPITGSDGLVHGFSEKVTPPCIEGAITDASDLDIKAIFEAVNVTVYLTKPNGKVVALKDAFFAGAPTYTTAEGEIPIKFIGSSIVEVN